MQRWSLFGKTVGMKTTGQEKYCVKVDLAAKSNWTKLKPFIAFKGGNYDVEKFKTEYGDKCMDGWIRILDSVG